MQKQLTEHIRQRWPGLPAALVDQAAAAAAEHAERELRQLDELEELSRGIVEHVVFAAHAYHAMVDVLLSAAGTQRESSEPKRFIYQEEV